MQIHFMVLKSFLIMFEFCFWCAWCSVDLRTHGVLVECVYVLLCLCLYVYHCTVEPLITDTAGEFKFCPL
jgi:hypothetical protein